jgi:hypothetical protein
LIFQNWAMTSKSRASASRSRPVRSRAPAKKIYGPGYSLLVFVYDKKDDPQTQTGLLEIQHTIFVQKERTADHQMTVALRRMIENRANRDDILAYFEDRALFLDEEEAIKLADEVLNNPPAVGYLTISNALQWRLQCSRVIAQAGKVDGVLRLV